MNKHDELVDRWKAGKLSLSECETAFDILQAYGDALERLGDQNFNIDDETGRRLDIEFWEYARDTIEEGIE